MFHSQNHAVVHKESVTGQEIVAENTANAPLELRIYGASRQEQSTQGKNLLDPHRLLPSNAATTIAINDNVITVTSTWYASIVVNVEKNSDYTIQCGITGSANTVPLRVTDVGDTTRLAALTGSVQTATFNTAELEQVKVWLYSGNGTEQTAAFTDLQLEAGTVATVYEAFMPNSPSPDYPSEIVSAVDFEVGSNTTAAINLTLRGIPDGSGGWAARDYIEAKDGAVRLVRECGEYVLNRDLIWTGWGPMESGLYSYYISRPDYKKATGKEDYIKSESWGYCDQFKWLGTFRVNGKDYRVRKEECISGFQGSSAMFMITTSQFTTMDAWKAHLDEEPLKLMAELETPQITDITATDLGQTLLSMKSVQYYTRIYHTSLLPVELEAAVTKLGSAVIS